MKKLAVALLMGVSAFSHASIPPAFNKLKETTVHIAIGSGFIFESDSNNTYLVTNWHVCNSGAWLNKLVASFADGEVVQGTITKKNPLYDLCAVKIPRRKAVLKLAKSLKYKQRLYTRGYPYGVLSQSEGQFLEVGEWANIYPIEEVGECFKGSSRILDGRGVVAGCQVLYRDNMTDLYSRPGSSGSPVVDENGDLVGVISSWDGGSDQGGMVQLEHVKEFFKGL